MKVARLPPGDYAPGPSLFRLKGAGATLLLGIATAAALRSWTIRKSEKGHWVLRGTVTRVDAFLCQQRGLLFTAPRDRHGQWAWPVERLVIERDHLKAILGHPEQ